METKHKNQTCDVKFDCMDTASGKSHGQKSDQKTLKILVNQKENNVHPPFSGQLEVDKNIEYATGRMPNELEKYIVSKWPHRKSKIDTLNKVVAYPSVYEQAKCALDAYEEHKALKINDLPSGWKVLTTASNRHRMNGYAGVAYWHPKKEQVVIAHRGTDPKNIGADWADLKGVIFGRYISQMHTASTFAHHILSFLKEINQKYDKNFQLFFTGHSLGGWLAQVTTFTVKYLTVHSVHDRFINANQEGYHAHTVVFDSPGCKTMLSQMQDSFAVRYDSGHALPIETLDINSYLSAPNRINTANHHVGKVYRIFIDFSNITYIQEKTSLYNLVTHSMPAILDAFDPKTGQVKKDQSGRLKIEEVVDWPISSGLSGGSEYSTFFKWATKFNAYHPDFKSKIQPIDFQEELQKKGYSYPIRYQTKLFDEQSCSMNVFSQAEQKFLKQYELLRRFPDFFKPSSLFSSLYHIKIQKKYQDILGKYTIQDDTIYSGSIEGINNIIDCVKKIFRFFPEKAKEVEEICSSSGIQNKLYQIYSDQYFTQINKSIGLLDFRNDGSPVSVTLKHFLGNKEQQVWQIDIKEYTDIGLTRVYTILKKATLGEIPLNYQDEYNHTILALKQLLSANQILGIQSLLVSKKRPHLLMVECNPSEVNQSAVEEVFKNLFQEVKSRGLNTLNPLTKIILITKQDNDTNSLTKVFERLINQNLDTGKYIVTRDEGFHWNSLVPQSQKALLERKIIFQGQKIALNALIRGNAIDQIVDAHTLVKLLNNNEEIEIGTKPLRSSDLDGAYTELFEDLSQDRLKINLHNSLSKVIYIINSVDKESQGHLRKKLMPNLERELGHINDMVDMLTFPYVLASSHKNIQLVDSGFQENNFKKICADHSDKKVYWIKWDQSKFILQKIYNPNFYIKRTFNKIVLKNKFETKNGNHEVLTQETEDKFVFSGINSISALAPMLDLPTKLINDKNRIFVTQNENDASKKFDQLHGTAHWLEIKTDGGVQQIIWRNSKGSLKSLRKYIDENHNQIFEEETLLESINDQQVVIIADHPGMGKSTTLPKLYQSKLFTSYWVIHLNLNNHLQLIKSYIDSDHINPIHAAECLANIDPKLADSLDQGILRSIFYNTNTCCKPLLIIFDGFDQVSDKENRNTLLALCKFLKSETNVKVWITSRLHYCKMLEDALLTFAITFNPMNDQKRRIFVENHLKNHLSLTLNKEAFQKVFYKSSSSPDKTNVRLYTEKFLEKVLSVFRDDVSKFISTPLQLFLLLKSKYFLEAFKIWARNPDRIPNFDYIGNNILEVYEGFINTKYDIYFKKAGITQKTIQYGIKQHLIHTLEGLAKLCVLGSQYVLEEESKEIALACGLIQYKNGDLTFIHQTFAEYFAARRCISWLTKETKFRNSNKQEVLLKNILIGKEYSVIRSFINAALARLEKEDKILPATSLEQYGETMSKLFQGDARLLDHKGGDYLLDIQVKENNPNIISFLVNSLIKSEDESMLKKFLSRKSGFNQYTPLHLAASAGYTSSIKALLAPLDLQTLQEVVKIENSDGRIPLDLAASAGHAGSVAALLAPLDPQTLREVIQYEDHDKATPLHGTALSGHLSVVALLVAPLDQETIKVLIKRKDEDGYTPLHLAAINGHVSVAESLLAPLDQETLKEVVKNRNFHGHTVLHLAAWKGHVSFVELLLTRLDPQALKELMECRDNGGNTFLHLISSDNQLEVFEHLVAYFKNHGDDNSVAFQQLIQATNNSGKTALELTDDKEKLEEIIRPFIGQIDQAKKTSQKIAFLETVRNDDAVTPSIPLLKQEACIMLDREGTRATLPTDPIFNSQDTVVQSSISDGSPHRKEGSVQPI